MRRRHPIPTTWLMTDERMGEGLWDALRRLPSGSGVIVRHYSLSMAERRALLRRITRVAGRRTLVLGAGGLVGRDGCHNGPPRKRGLMTRSVHDRREAVAATRAGADAAFVSPVFSTRSHVGQRVLGRRGLAALASHLPMPVIALGGMTAGRYRSVRSSGAYGWAAIDAWSRDAGGNGEGDL